MSDPAPAQRRLEELERERAELRRQLAVVYASRSWRLTAPLRRAGVLARSLSAGRARPPASATAAASADVPAFPPPAAGADDPAFPPPALRARVAGTPDLDWFRDSARLALEDLDAALAPLRRTLDSFPRVLDFGCGCGRLTLPLVARLGPGRVTAGDSDAEAAAWLRARLPGERVDATPVLPPLPHGDGAFDLIVGWSVFTHLPEDHQDAWLAELARVLAPGGVALATVHGPGIFELMGSAPDDPVRLAVARAGFVHFRNHGPDSPFPEHYQTAYHDHGYIRERWSRWFEVAAIHAGGARPNQDMVVLRARVTPAPG
jgi:SAM-dependent methyltransferase